MSLDGLAVQGLTDRAGFVGLAPLAGVIPAGGYVLVAFGSARPGGAPLPAPDFAAAGDLPAAGGMVALTSTPVRFPRCGMATLDAVAYGGATVVSTCIGEAAPAAPPPDAGAALARAGGGCVDGNGNPLDFAVQLAVPRNAASPAAACSCDGRPVNGTGLTVEMDFCSVHFPLSLQAPPGAGAATVFGRVFEPGLTEPAGPPAGIMGQLGFGPAGTDPRWSPGWSWVAASYSAQFGNDDELQATFTAPAAPGAYVYAYRFSPDGVRWTYCDPNGAGSAAGLAFEPNGLPVLTVTGP